MKLQVGMYVRTKLGINKINEYVPQSGQLYLKTDVCVKSNVLKASNNIIDLIEVGDYVNGEKVGEVIKKEMYHFGDGIIIKNEDGKDIYSNFRYSKYEKIKSIVTKEQFESIQYKVVE